MKTAITSISNTANTPSMSFAPVRAMFEVPAVIVDSFLGGEHDDFPVDCCRVGFFDVADFSFVAFPAVFFLKFERYFIHS